MSDAEAGAFRACDGYLDAEGLVVPIIGNRWLWHRVGLSVDQEQVPDRLIFNLCQGMDLQGLQITNTAMYKGPLEVILTVHCEVSEAMESAPDVARQTLLAMVSELLREIEARSRLLRIAGAGREWCSSSVLSLAFLHARNNEDEPHFHAHVLVFPATFEIGTGWRTFYERDFFNRLNNSDGIRFAVGMAARREAAKHGFKLEFTEGLASALVPNGATVTCPDGRIFDAGSVVRIRSAKILADRTLKHALGATPLTLREVRLLVRNPGAAPEKLAGICRPEYFVHKLRVLGLLDENRRIVQANELALVIRRLEASMAMAQISLGELSTKSDKQTELTAKTIESQREKLLSEFPDLKLQHSMKMATIHWTKAFIAQLKQVVMSEPNGLRIDEIAQSGEDILLQLVRARLVCLEAIDDRRVIRITELGQFKLAKIQAKVELASKLRYAQIHHLPTAEPVIDFSRREKHPGQRLNRKTLELILERKNGPDKDDQCPGSEIDGTGKPPSSRKRGL